MVPNWVVQRRLRQQLDQLTVEERYRIGVFLAEAAPELCQQLLDKLVERRSTHRDIRVLGHSAGPALSAAVEQ